MTSSLQSQIIKKLKVASIQYQHEQFLKKRHFSEEGKYFFSTIIPRYQRKLNIFFGIKKNYNSIKYTIDRMKLDVTPEESITVRRFVSEEDIREVARKSSVYFQQGLEMLETSFSMPENTSPLVEYYALLQCAKGSIILELDVKEELFFTKHGIRQTKKVKQENLSKYLNVQIMPLGVFSTFAIRFAFFIDQRKENNDDPFHYKNDIVSYFDESYLPSLENIVVGDVDVYNIRTFNSILSAFIGSWMLSSLVRYAPMKWQEILAGQENDLVTDIRKFREERLLQAFDSVLPTMYE